MKTIKYLIYTSLLFLSYSHISYGAILDVRSGNLFGASGVNVDGSLYDVQFKEGVCADLYTGCDEKSDFAFSNPLNDGTLLRIAMQSLLDQVFIDSSEGLFDSMPSLTNGCIVILGCNIFSPIFISGSSGIGVGFTFNSGTTGRVDITGTAGRDRNFNSDPGPLLARFDQSVYAVWSLTTATPIPPSGVPGTSSILLLCAGLFGLLGSRKRILKNV